MTPTAAFRFATDTATLAVFDPARLNHRLSDSADWWSLRANEVAEINLGNMFSISTGSDGYYDAEVFIGNALNDVSDAEALIACDSGQIFVGPGEVIPSDGLPTTDQFGGRFFQVTPGTYRVRVSRPSASMIRVSLTPFVGKAENQFKV